MSESLTEQMLVHIQSAVEQRDATSAGTIPLSALIVAVGEIGSLETAQRLKAAALEVRERRGWGGGESWCRIPGLVCVVGCGRLAWRAKFVCSTQTFLWQ